MSKYEKPQKLSREAKAVEMSFQEVYKLATDRKIGWIKAKLDALSVFKKQEIVGTMRGKEYIVKKDCLLGKRAVFAYLSANFDYYLDNPGKLPYYGMKIDEKSWINLDENFIDRHFAELLELIPTSARSNSQFFVIIKK